jgi:hypothetical protein
VDPRTLVVRIVDHFGCPWTLVVRVINHGRFPFTIIFIVPVIRLLSIRIRNFRRNIVVSLRFDIVRIGNFGSIDPISWLGCIGVFDFFWFEEGKFILEVSGSYRFVIDKDFKGVIWTNNKGIKVREYILFT